MTTRIFFAVILLGAITSLPRFAQAQISVQFGSSGHHYPSSPRQNYDHARREQYAVQAQRVQHARQVQRVQHAQRDNRNLAVNHYLQDQRRSYDHAVRDLTTRGRTNLYSSPQHSNSVQRQQSNHYRNDQRRNYDQAVHNRSPSASHYQPRRYSH